MALVAFTIINMVALAGAAYVARMERDPDCFTYSLLMLALLDCVLVDALSLI